MIALAFVVGMLLPAEASAYVGPGAGLSALGTVIAFLGALVMALIGFVWYPMKRLLRRLRGGRSAQATKPVTE
jgi:hypothetical protein